jgi:putative ABC transport system permease protein
MTMRLLPFTYAARNLGRSTGRLAMSVGGSLLVSLLAMGGTAFVLGMDGALRASGLDRNVVLLGAGSEESAERSEIAASTAGVVVASLRGIASIDGQPLASPEVNVALAVDARATAGDGEAPDAGGLVRGVTPMAFLVHPQVRMRAGRAPQAGSDEVALGRSAARAAGIGDASLAAGLDAGGEPSTVRIDGRPCRVVGLFDAPGTVMDGEAWMPLTDVLVLTRRETISAVVVTLAPGATPGQVDAFAQRRIDLELSAIHEPEYYATQGAFFRPVQVMVAASAGLVALGALLGGLNTMYGAFASRIRELAMLQVLGFGRAAIVVSMSQEALVASMAGALAAAALAAAFLDGIAVHFSMGTFALRVDERTVAVGLAAGLVTGIAGCVAPAVRCLRMQIPSALKAD